MSKEAGYRYYEAGSSTIPGPAGRNRASRANTTAALPGETTSPLSVGAAVVQVSAGAGDKCVAAARSKPKRRQTIRNPDDKTDSLGIPAVEWTNETMAVSELTDYQCPMLVRVSDDCADFSCGQVAQT